jgi:hypothetical protein
VPDNPNSFLETTDVYDVDTIRGLDVDSEEFKEFLVRLRQNVNNIAISVNNRDGGFYPLGEFNTGRQLFPILDPVTNELLEYRSILRDTIDFGALPNAGVKLVNHHINPPTGTTIRYVFTHIYGAATNPTLLTALPIPYSDPAGNIISLNVTQTQVGVQTNFNASLYTGIIVLEYIIN